MRLKQNLRDRDRLLLNGIVNNEIINAQSGHPVASRGELMLRDVSGKFSLNMKF